MYELCFLQVLLFPVTGVVVTNLGVTNLQTGVAAKFVLQVDEVIQLILVDTFEVGAIRSLSLKEVELVA